MTPENLRKQNIFIFDAICDEFEYNFTNIIDKIDAIELFEEINDCELWKIILMETGKKHLAGVEEYYVTEWWAIIDIDDRSAALFKNEESAKYGWNKYLEQI